MKPIVFLLGSLMLFSGCTKTEEVITIPSDPILYTEITPEVVVSYDTINNVNYYRIDLNHDSAIDFSFSAFRQKIDYYGHIFYGYMFGCSGWGMNRVTLLQHNASTPGIVTLYDSAMIIDSTLTMWRQESYLHFDVPLSYGYKCQTDSSKYLGLMVYKNNRQFYGWIKLDWDKATLKLTVKSFAIRNEPDRAIRAGEN